LALVILPVLSRPCQLFTSYFGLGLALGLFWLPGAGQRAIADDAWAANYSLREWHAQDGLPSEDVTRLHQDRAGFLWMATSRGLARFDGVYFENFGPALRRAGGAVNIRAMAETAELGLIVAPTSGGTFLFRDGEFRPFDFATDRVVNAMFAEPDGTLWASCDDQTLLRRPQDGRTEIFRPNEGSPHRLVAHFAVEPGGRVWIAGATMFARYEHGTLRAIHTEFDGPEFRVVASRAGGPWILTVDRLLKQGVGGVSTVLRSIPPLVGAHYVTVMHEDRQGTLWIGTRSQGLYAVVDGRLRAVPTSGEAIAAICEDTEGDLWVACNGGGLNRLRFRDFKIYDRSSGLGDNFSFTVSEDPTGAMWLGNRDGGVARLRDGRIEAFTNWPGQAQVSVTSVLPDTKGGVWVTNGAGVFRIDTNKGDRMERVEAIPAKPTVRVAYVARNGDYWVGLDPDRVGRFRDGRFETFGPAEGYEGKQLRVITEDERGRILIGTGDGRLVRFDGRHFTRIPLMMKDDPEAPIQDIHCERETGLLWVGTSGNGVYALRPDGGLLRQLLPVDGLIDSNITAILPDDQGYLWFGSTSGIFCLKRQELADFLAGRISRLHPVVVGRDDGVHGLTCLGLYKPAAWKSRDGRLWFATRKGVLNFDPAKAITDTASPPAFVAALRCDDEVRPLSREIVLTTGVRKLELRLSVLCLSTPDRVRIKYRLEGFDSDWVTAGPDRLITYPRLPPGTYRLRTMSSLGNGVWNETPSALVLTVVPRWWQTWWFQASLAALAVGGVVLIVRAVSHRRLRLRLDRLEQESAVERERARIARNIHDDLGASLTRISLLTQAARRDENTEEGRRLGQIYETVRQITRSMDEIVWAVNPKNDHLDGLVSYLVSYAQGFLAVAGIRCRLDLPESLPTATLTSQVRHNLYLCLKEALNNVVKHSGAGEVMITMRVVANSFTLEIADNGRAAGTNGNGHAAHQDLRVRPGQGLGNIAQRVVEMNGTWEFTPPAAGQGARLVITITLEPPRSPGRSPATLFRPSTP
jgi:signal transduction histidine kinase/ligand-binding sensor domain-containing protein